MGFYRSIALCSHCRPDEGSMLRYSGDLVRGFMEMGCSHKYIYIYTYNIDVDVDIDAVVDIDI